MAKNERIVNQEKVMSNEEMRIKYLHFFWVFFFLPGGGGGGEGYKGKGRRPESKLQNGQIYKK